MDQRSSAPGWPPATLSGDTDVLLDIVKQSSNWFSLLWSALNDVNAAVAHDETDTLTIRMIDRVFQARSPIVHTTTHPNESRGVLEQILRDRGAGKWLGS